MSIREQKLLVDTNTRYIAFLSRLINFLEDLIDDAWCRTVYVSKNVYTERPLEPSYIVIEPVECSYDVEESIEIFSRQWDLDTIDFRIGKGDIAFSDLYYFIPSFYSATLHYLMKNYATKTVARRREYFLAILFNGKGFILEGEEDRVTIPFIKHCVSAHTHPSSIPMPSKKDIETVMNLMLNRGFLHVIETPASSLYIYRVGVMGEEELIKLRTIEHAKDYRELLNIVRELGSGSRGPLRLEIR